MSARRVWVGTGWKMNKRLAEAQAYCAALLAAGPGDPRISRFLVPPFTVLRDVARALAGSDVLIGAQTMHWDDSGAWTGEISAPMIADCGAVLVELGHSERRTHFGETDETVGLKAAAALRHGLMPLICVGETEAERAAGQADAALAWQVTAALARLPSALASAQVQVLFAYEPVWAIGTGGRPAEPGYAAARIGQIKAVAADRLGAPPPCLYGGSVTPATCTSLIAAPDIDGLFIGRAAWQPEGYLGILRQVSAALDQGERPS